ncbi:MAG: hypothetical protein R3E89_09580 [Thiolinea sp.]
MVHERWPHIPEEWDDYIANRKPNGCQSIHTVVIGPRGRNGKSRSHPGNAPVC